MSHLKFFTKLGIISPFLFNSFTTNKSGLMFAVISCNNKVNTSVNTYNITNIRNITFFNLIGNWYMQIVLTLLLQLMTVNISLDLLVVKLLNRNGLIIPGFVKNFKCDIRHPQGED